MLALDSLELIHQQTWVTICDDLPRFRRTQSDSSSVRYKFNDLNKPTNESNWWDQTAEDKAHDPQPWTPTVWCMGSSVSRSLLPVLSSTCFTWKTEKDERSRHEVKIIQQSADGPDTGPKGFGSSPPAAPITVLTRNSMVQANGAAGALRGPQCFVRRLLRELIASIPLLPSDAKHANITETPIKMIRPASTARSQSSPPPRRSLSVQTHACEGFQDQSWRETRPAIPAKHRLSESFRKGEERWKGGVRALRDAHVRLVLRQLRHVERLNRALDRRTIARPPTL